MPKHERVWIRLAGHATRIKSDQPYHWRFYINDHRREHPINSFKIFGQATERNLKPGTNPKGDFRGLVAWIDLFCDVDVDALGNATIRLLEVSHESE